MEDFTHHRAIGLAPSHDLETALSEGRRNSQEERMVLPNDSLGFWGYEERRLERLNQALKVRRSGQRHS